MWCVKNAARNIFYVLKNASFALSVSPNSPRGRTLGTPYDPRFALVGCCFNIHLEKKCDESMNEIIEKLKDLEPREDQAHERFGGECQQLLEGHYET